MVRAGANLHNLVLAVQNYPIFSPLFYETGLDNTVKWFLWWSSSMLRGMSGNRKMQAKPASRAKTPTSRARGHAETQRKAGMTATVPDTSAGSGVPLERDE